MTLRRLILSLLTLLVVVSLVSRLVSSWNAPQITDRLQLYQTDLLLHASEIQRTASGTDLTPARTALLGTTPLETALEQYQTVRETAQESLEKFQARAGSPDGKDGAIAPLDPTDPRDVEVSLETQQAKSSLAQQHQLIDQLDIRIGILQAEQAEISAALNTWESVASREQAIDSSSSQSAALPVVDVLMGLWSDPPRLLPDAEPQINQALDGWFRYRVLARFYDLQQRPDALTALQAAEQDIAQQTFIKLTLIGILPIAGCVFGITLLGVLLVQRWRQGTQSLLAQNAEKAWEVPWEGEIVWQVLIVGFFFVGQFLLPTVIQLVISQLPLAALGSRANALTVLASYLLLAASTLLVLYFSIKPTLPLRDDWFRLQPRGNWFLWGAGGYLVALPLMILVSLLNQLIWQGEGGSNPLLQIVLEERDPVSLGIFFFTAAIAAPVFEEALFRGFLLPSLTRYFPVGGAIALSSLLFAVAHLSLSEVLPLTLLGAILGVVYTRSRNLLAPMLLHCLWNSFTMLGLLLLGSGAR